MNLDTTPQDELPSATIIVQDHAFSLIIETSLYTLYVVLVLYLASRTCATRKARSLPLFMVFYTLSMFAFFTLYWILDIYFLWAEFHSLLSYQVDNTHELKLPEVHQWKGASWINKDGLLPQYRTAVYVQYIVQLILIAFGDFVSLWRAYTVFGRRRWLRILGLCVALVESGVYILVSASSSTQYLSPLGSVSRSAEALGEARTPLTFLGYAITGLAQLGSTALIAYKAWVHWRDVREFMNRSATRRSFTALVIIIESGIIYVVFLTWYGAITYFGPSTSLLVYTCRFYSAPLIAMYPTLVVVLVASRRSVLERSIVSVTLTENGPPRVRQHVAGRQESMDHFRPSVCPSCSTFDGKHLGDGENEKAEAGANGTMRMTKMMAREEV